MSEGKQKPIALIIIIIILLLVIGVMGYLLMSEKEMVQDLSGQRTELTENLKALVIDLDNKEDSLEHLFGLNESLDGIIIAREQEIEKSKAEIKRLLSKTSLTKADLQRANQLIAELRLQNQAYGAKIDSLYSANAALFEEKIALQDNLKVEKEVNQQLTEENKYLADKFEIGALLRTNGLSADGIRIRQSGKEVEVKRVAKTEKIRICFETGVNKVREAGKVEMLVRIVDPDGVTMAVQSKGSGTFNDKSSGQEMEFTRKADFDYDNTNKKICVLWGEGISKSGVYTAQVYQDGYLVGENLFELK